MFARPNPHNGSMFRLSKNLTITPKRSEIQMNVSYHAYFRYSNMFPQVICGLKSTSNEDWLTKSPHENSKV